MQDDDRVSEKRYFQRVKKIYDEKYQVNYL